MARDQRRYSPDRRRRASSSPRRHGRRREDRTRDRRASPSYRPEPERSERQDRYERHDRRSDILRQQCSNCHAVSTLFLAFLGTEVVHLQTSQRELCQVKLRSGGRRRSGYRAFATGKSHGVVGYSSLRHTSALLYAVVLCLCAELDM